MARPSCQVEGSCRHRNVFPLFAECDANRSKPCKSRITSNAKDTRWKIIAGAFRCARCEQLGSKGEFNCDVAVLSYLTAKERTMKLTTLALATAFALTSTVALAQA